MPGTAIGPSGSPDPTESYERRDRSRTGGAITGVVLEITVGDVPHLRRTRPTAHWWNPPRPAMVSADLPWRLGSCRPGRASVKRHMVLWRKRFQREYGEPASYIWKLEFQRRGAPHIHLWMAPPISPGRSGRGSAQWLWRLWAVIVDHSRPQAEGPALPPAPPSMCVTAQGVRP